MPRPEIFGVEPDVKGVEVGKRRQLAAQSLPGVVLGCNGDAADVRLRISVWSGKINFCQYRFYAKTDVDIPNVFRGRVSRQEIPCYYGVGKTEGEDIFESNDAL